MVGISIGYTGQRRSGISGHYLLGNGFRGFNPIMKRFMGQDSLSPFGMGGMNGYAYCGGDSINSTDPSGHIFGLKALLLFFMMDGDDAALVGGAAAAEGGGGAAAAAGGAAAAAEGGAAVAEGGAAAAVGDAVAADDIIDSGIIDSDITLTRYPAWEILQGPPSDERELYIVAHGGRAEDEFETPIDLRFYCRESDELLLDSCHVISGEVRLPNVVDQVTHGSVTRDYLLRSPDYNNSRTRFLNCMKHNQIGRSIVSFDVLYLTGERPLKLSRILNAIPYNEYDFVNCLFCRT